MKLRHTQLSIPANGVWLDGMLAHAPDVRALALCLHSHGHPALEQAARPRDDAAKRDQWATRLSRITGHNIAAVFDAWNIPLSDEARRACAQYPKPADPRLFEGVL